MNSKVKTLTPSEFLAEFMRPGSKRTAIFKKDFGHFYIAKIQDLSEISNPPIPPVRAKTHTLIFLTRGALVMKVGFLSIKVYKNECVIIPASQVFSHENKEEEPAQGFICGFNESFLVGRIGNAELLKTFEYLTVWGNPVIRPKGKNPKFIVQSLQRILYEYSQNGINNKLILASHLIATLCDLNIDYQSLSDNGNKTAIALTNRFKELLHQNLRTKHKVSDYASLLHVSPNHLNKTVKLITQRSPSEWIIESLVTEAKVLLFQSNQSIAEIATELGIYDQSYFSRLFRKYEGISPLAYRKMIDLS